MTTLFTPCHRGGAGPPLVCLHGFTDTWRTWQLVLPALERRHDVLAPTLPGHAGGPPLAGPIDEATMPDAVERAMDAAGIVTAHLVGNSLGGFVALQLAARGRARSVVALAPAGGWAPGDPAADRMLADFVTAHEQARLAAPHAAALVATPEGRRRATAAIVADPLHMPADLIAHQMLGLAACRGVGDMVGYALRAGYRLDAAAIDCPVRVVWGTADRLLPWPGAAVRFRREWLPTADRVELEGVGHCPQLDDPHTTAALILEFTGAVGPGPQTAGGGGSGEKSG